MPIAVPPPSPGHSPTPSRLGSPIDPSILEGPRSRSSPNTKPHAPSPPLHPQPHQDTPSTSASTSASVCNCTSTSTSAPSCTLESKLEAAPAVTPSMETEAMPCAVGQSGSPTAQGRRCRTELPSIHTMLHYRSGLFPSLFLSFLFLLSLRPCPSAP